jgi:hypothetical protein
LTDSKRTKLTLKSSATVRTTGAAEEKPVAPAAQAQQAASPNADKVTLLYAFVASLQNHDVKPIDQ